MSDTDMPMRGTACAGQAYDQTAIPDPGTTRAILLAHQFVLALVFFLAVIYLSSGLRAAAAIRPACILLALLVAWSLWSWRRLTGSLFEPYALFLITATLFNGGQALLEIFGLNRGGMLGGVFSAEALLQALFFVIVGLALLHLGALLGAAGASRRAASRSTGPTDRDLRLVGWTLLIVGAAPEVIEAKRAIATVMTSGYFAFIVGQPTGLERWPRVLGMFLVPGALFLLAGSRGRQANYLVSAAAVVGFAVVDFFLGFRAWGSMALVAYAWLWHHRIRRLPVGALLAAGAIMLFAVFPLISRVRGAPASSRTSGALVRQAFIAIGNPAVAILSEMGGTLKTVAYTIQLVPRTHAYELGQSYLNAMFTAIPSVFWEKHPAREHLPRRWLAMAVDPAAAALGRGFGYSFIAEAYLNFGWFGGPALLAVMGFLLARFSLWARRSGQPANMALLASFTAMFLIYARADAAVLRQVLWYAVLPYAAAWMAAGLRGPASGRVAAR